MHNYRGAINAVYIYALCAAFAKMNVSFTDRLTENEKSEC